MGRSVCVVIPSVGNADELGIALDSLMAQTYYGPLEVVVVGPEKDPGRQQAESRGLRFIDDAGSRTRADACNVALGLTESDLVMFTDDDVIVPKDWVEKLARWFERSEVAGVGGPNFAPPENSTLQQQIIDVSFCSRIFTAGTNYGRRGESDLEEVEQLPGVNSAYRRSILAEVGGFPPGCIGAEDVILDHNIRQSGHRLWTDSEAVIWHRRRDLSSVKKQIRNYGLVRSLASHEHHELRTWSHVMVAMFPPIVITAFAFFFWGLYNGGLASPWWDISFEAVPLGWPRAGVHSLVSLIVLYNLIAWYGAAKGSSPCRTPKTVFLSSIATFVLHWNYGMGVLRGWWRIFTGNSGLQIDDRIRG
jgi:cellulose synthase/poly-beta-1,6-N-acetylglucosamine synthase-like glycosyltransferase